MPRKQTEPKRRTDTVSVSPAIYERIKRVADARGQTVKEAVDAAIAYYLDSLTPEQWRAIDQVLALRSKL